MTAGVQTISAITITFQATFRHILEKSLQINASFQVGGNGQVSLAGGVKMWAAGG